jgi:hypothetical protein
MDLRLALLLLLSAGLLSAFITVPPMYGDFRVAYKWAEGPGFVAVVGIDDTPRNITLFTEEGFSRWMKDKPGTAIYNGVLRRGDVLIIETPPGRYVLAVYPQPISGNKTQTYAKSYSGWAPVGVMSLPREPITTSAAAGYFEIHRLKARNEGEVKDGASIQFNTIVVLELADGGRQYYFVQNVLDLYTDTEKYRFVATIFNHTSKSGSFTSEVKGRGKFYWHIYAWSYYGYATREERYSLPFSGFLIINVSSVGGVARIDFGYSVGRGAVWYDSVMIKPYVSVERAYILAGHAVTPIRTIASLELVLCGLNADSPRAELEEVDVRLALLVWDGAGWRSPPRLYNFGFNTAEMVSLNVETRLINGTVHITRGAFKPLLLAEEPPEPDIPPPSAAFKPHTDSWLLVTVAALILVTAGGIWIRRRASRARRRSFRRL